MVKNITRPKTVKTDKDKEQMAMAIRKLIDHLGGLHAAHEFLGVKYQVLQGWRTRSQIPLYQARKIEQVPALRDAGFTVEFMRPDTVV